MAISAAQSAQLQLLLQTGDWENVKSVCELGSQRPLYEEIADLFDIFSVPSPAEGYTAREFYYQLGARRYASIDIDGNYGAHRFDLNRDLVQAYGFDQSFDMVTNFGTTQVLFDQFTCFRNIHRLTNPDGFMLHTAACHGWGRNCFVKYDVNLFRDLAKANGYEILLLKPFLRLAPLQKFKFSAAIEDTEQLLSFVKSIFNHVGNLEEPIDKHAWRELEGNHDVQNALEQVGAGRALFNVSLSCIYRKHGDGEFKAPIMSHYLK